LRSFFHFSPRYWNSPCALCCATFLVNPKYFIFPNFVIVYPPP
jgi:hypothetical protein